MRRLLFTGLGVALSIALAGQADAGDRRERRTKRDRSHRHVVSKDQCGVRSGRIHRALQRRIEHARRHATRCDCRRVRVPGHYKVVYDNVQRPGCYENVWVPDRYEYVTLACGSRVRQLVCAGHYERVWRPGRVDRVSRRVWIAPRFEVRRCGRHRHR